MNKKDELKFRRNIILSFIFVLGMFTVMTILNFSSGDLVWTFYPSFAVGVLLGVATCIYFSEIWDPKLLVLKKHPENTSKKHIPWGWAPPLGVLAGNIIAQFLDNGIRNLFMGLLVGWFYMFFSYVAVQVWRHRPR